jgi:DNA-binding ferritin-like protein (Dps family)
LHRWAGTWTSPAADRHDDIPHRFGHGQTVLTSCHRGSNGVSPNYRMAVEAIERYLMYFVPADGDSAASMFEDLADLFEQAAADGTPIREIVGEDPVEFVEAFVQNYSEGGYVPTRGRKRLTDAIAHAEEERPR